MRAGDLAEAFGRQRCTEQVISGLGGRLIGGIAPPDHLAYGGQTGPSVTLLQPFYFGRNQAGTSLGAAVIAVGGCMFGRGLVPRIVKQLANIGMQRAVIGLERQDVVTSLFDNLPCDL